MQHNTTDVEHSGQQYVPSAHGPEHCAVDRPPPAPYTPGGQICGTDEPGGQYVEGLEHKEHVTTEAAPIVLLAVPPADETMQAHIPSITITHSVNFRRCELTGAWSHARCISQAVMASCTCPAHNTNSVQEHAFELTVPDVRASRRELPALIGVVSARNTIRWKVSTCQTVTS
jgi:hypothetical protein